MLSDVFFRIGGAILGKATTSLVVNSDNVLLDNLWVWRADHGNPGTVGWTINTADTGVIINGDDVTAYGLFVEHYQKYQTIWNGENGRTIFFQNEMPYDPPNQAAWMRPDGVKGYPAYKVADSVKTHEAWGMGSYSFFNAGQPIYAARAFEVPVKPGVKLYDILTVFLNGSGGIDHVVNDTGAAVNATNQVVNVVSFPVALATQASANVVIGNPIHDTATLTGASTSPVAGGSITFKLYGPDDATCTGAAIFTATVPVSGNASYGSGDFTPTAVGTYRWIANYSGDTNNMATRNSCNDANESVAVSPAKTQMDLPVTFDSPTVAYGLLGFGGAEDSTIVVDPTGGTNKVAKVVKSATAELWAGTTLTADGTLGFASKIPFTASATRMTVRVYSPDAGIQVRLKVEDAADPTKSVETEATTTVANAWETLTFDFANQAPGTAALNLAYTYDKASIFFNFGVTGATAGAKTYYFDDVAFGGTTPPPATWSPITFDSSAVTYTLTGFGGAEDSTVVVDPTNAANNVAKVVKSATAELWAGTTVSTGPNFSVPTLPFTASSTKMTVRVWSPDAGIQVRLKVEDAADPTKSVETEATTTVANAWETLTFDFANQAPALRR